ncbi:MAG: hypothetical protein HY321_00160 [Armatimonadetes bacterium]|nr:hypothetical protein [Armatimonadota bacterium]
MGAVASKQARYRDLPSSESPSPPEVTGLAASLFAEALEACLRKLGPDGRDAALTRLQSGESTAVAYLHHELACRVAERLAAFDQNIKAVYLLDEMDTAEDAWQEGTRPTTMIQLVIWARTKTAALTSLASAFDDAILPKYTALMGVHQMSRLLMIHFMDDADVEGRVGFGSLLASIRHRPIRIWQR